MNEQGITTGQKMDRRTALGLSAGSVLSAAAWRRVPGANDRVRLGFIGFGLIGKRHLMDFGEQPDVELVGVAETHRGRREEALHLMGAGAKGYADFRALLDDQGVDAVVISTPDHWHALQTILACAASKDVYVEKPLTLFVREGRWMIEAAKRNRRVVQVGTQQRSGPHYQRAKELIERGRLGPIHSVRMTAYRNIMPGYGRPDDCNPPAGIDWQAWLGPAPDRPYNPNRCIYHFRWFWDYSGGQMTNLGFHSLDILHWSLGLKAPIAVMSAGGRFSLQDNGETPDTQDAIFEYPGFTAVWSHREASNGVSHEPPIEFLGSRGSLVVSRKGFKLTPDRRLPPANTVPQFTGAHPVGGPQPVVETGPPRYWTEPLADDSGDARDQFKRHARNFLDCIKSRSQPISDLVSAHQVAIAAHLANLSLRLGRKIRWDPDLEDIVDDRDAAAHLVRPYRSPWDKELQALGLG